MGNETRIDVPRIDRRFVTAEGSLTDSAYAFLYKLWRRTGGAFGDEEKDLQSDVEASIFALAYELSDRLDAAPQALPAAAAPDDVRPPLTPWIGEDHDLYSSHPETRDKLAEAIKRLVALELIAFSNSFEQLENQMASIRESIAKAQADQQGLMQGSLV